MSVEERVLALEKYRDEMRSAITVYPNFIKLNRQHSGEVVTFTVPLTTPAWENTTHSTIAKTGIDIPKAYGTPTGIKQVLVKVTANDSGSASNNCYIALAPNDTADSFQLVCKPYGLPNDVLKHDGGWVNCAANGYIYYQVLATGSNTLDVTIQVWGYSL